MSFKGDLSTIGLAEVFQMISMSQKEGTLIVKDADSRKCIFFGATGVQLLSSGRRKGMKVGELLLRAGKVTEAQLEEALETGRISKKLVGEVLVESGAVSSEEIQQIVREQIEEEIYDLFLWKKADFEFVEGPAADDLKDPDAQVTKLSFDVNGLLLEAVRRADEWAIINQSIPSIDSIFVFVSESDRHEEDKTSADAAKRVYRLVDGRMPVSEIVENTGISKFEACKILVDLYNRGRIRLLTVPETMDLALKRMAEGNRERGMRMYLAAAAQAPDDAKVIAQVAKFLEGEGLAKEAAGYHVKAGHIFLEQGDLDRAMDHMQRAAAGNPDEPEIQMGMFEVHAAAGNLDEGKKLAHGLITQALMAPNLPRARALCDRIVAADPADLQFRVLRAKALHRAGLRKELAEDLEFIKKNMPVDAGEAEKIDRELKEVLIKRPSSVHPKPGSGTAQTPSQVKTQGRWKLGLIAGAALLAVAAGLAGYVEVSAKNELDRRMAASRASLAKFAFLDARRDIDKFLESTLSPSQKKRALAFLRDEVEVRQKTWEEDRKRQDENERREALEKMKNYVLAIEDDRQNHPSEALRKAQELRAFAEKHKDPDYIRKADELAQGLESYLGASFQLKAKADALEKEGKLRDAALLVDRLLNEFPNTDAARGALYPIDLVTRPSGVKVTNLRTGMVIGETVDGVLRYRMKPTEAVRLAFEKSGYGSVEKDVKDKSVGRFQVELGDKREKWLLPIGFPVQFEPAANGEMVYVSGAGRLYAFRTTTKKLAWYEPLDGLAEGSPKAAADRVYVGSSTQSVIAVDPKLPEGEKKKVVWKYEAGDRVSGTPGLSVDGSVVYIGTYERMLHAINAKTGEGMWKREVPAEVRVEPLAIDSLVVVACVDGTVLGVRGPRPEDEVWRIKALDGAPGPMTYAEGILYLAGADLTVVAIDPLKGQRLWRRVLPSNVSGRAVRVGSAVCAAGRDGKVYFLDAANGESLWTYEAQGYIQGGVVAAGNLVLFGSDDQYLYAVDVALKSVAWKLKCRSKVRVAPAVGAGMAFFGTDEGLYAVELN